MNTTASLTYARRQDGFSLLEAIVAIAIMAGAGMAIFGWINTNLLSITKIEQRAYKDHLIRSASEFMQGVDIMQEQSGQAQLSKYTIRWNSILVEPLKEGKNKTGGLSEFRLGLFDTVVNVILDEQVMVLFDLRLVGYKQVRDHKNVF